MSSIQARYNKQNLSINTNCVVGISIHNPNLSGDRLKDIIDWINSRDNFTRCYIDLSDSLYRHNYMQLQDISEEDAIKKARYHGDKWISRHEIILHRLRIPYYIIRWDRWLNHPDFESMFNKYKEIYQDNKALRTSILSDVSVFYERRGKSIGHVLPKEINHCVNFMLEELACHTLMYRDLKASTLYPGNQPKCYKLIKSGEVPNVPFGLENSHFTRLVFRDVGALQKSDLLRTEEKAAA